MILRNRDEPRVEVSAQLRQRLCLGVRTEFHFKRGAAIRVYNPTLLGRSAAEVHVVDAVRHVFLSLRFPARIFSAIHLYILQRERLTPADEGVLPRRALKSVARFGNPGDVALRRHESRTSLD